MVHARRCIGISLVLLMGMLAGCNFGSDDGKEQPKENTPVAMATAPSDTLVPTAPFQQAPEVVIDASSTPLPTQLSAVQPSPVSSMIPAPPPTFTPVTWAISTPVYIPPAPTDPSSLVIQQPVFTNTPFVSAQPLSTNTPDAGVSPSPFVTWTNTPLPIVTVAPTTTLVTVEPGGNAFPPPPTFTPSSGQPTAVAELPPAQVCATCGNLRLRSSPGTAGQVIAYLSANTPLDVIGRTEDSAWVQVVAMDGRAGWVATRYLDINIDLSAVSVTGMAEDAPVPQPDNSAPSGDNWMVSGVSSHARQIFLDGLAKGNSPYSFVRVGDSISAAPMYLTPIGEGSYQLGSYGYLGNAVSFFSGPTGRGLNPFLAPSMAAQNGWGTTSALDSNNADPSLCRSGETPLECEYRVSKPSVALIMFGTNDSGGLPTADFQVNLRRIVQISINMGVIPVLSTIPPKHYDSRTDGRVPEFNQVITATARAYDIPLWDYYQSMVRIPGEGLSGDGVHPNSPPDGGNAIFDAQHLQYGFPVRNFGALQVLYTLWQQVLYDADTARPATAPAPQPTTAPPVATSAPVDPDTYSCPGTLPIRLRVGGQGRVTPGLPNKMRSAPGSSTSTVGSVPGEAVFTVVGGPQCADGYTWWQINYQGTVGWTASGNSQEYWVEPYP